MIEVTRFTVNELSEPTSIRILTQKNKGANHHETALTIHWDNISVEQLKCMAAHLVVQKVQQELKSQDDPIPEELSVAAVMYWREFQPAEQREFQIPESWKSGSDKPEGKQKEKKPTLEDLLQALSPEELAALLAN